MKTALISQLCQVRLQLTGMLFNKDKSDNLKEIGYWLPLFSALEMEESSAKQAPADTTTYSLHFELPNVVEFLRLLLSKQFLYKKVVC